MKTKILFLTLTFLFSFHALGGMRYDSSESVEWTTKYPSLDTIDYLYVQLSEGHIIQVHLQGEDREFDIPLQMAYIEETTGTGGSGHGGRYEEEL